MGSKVSSKIKKIFQIHIPKLLDEKKQICQETNLSEEKIMDLLDRSIETVAGKLKYINMIEIQKMELLLNQELVEIVKEKFHSSGYLTTEQLEQEEKVELQLEILKKSIQLKKVYQSTYSHPVERNIIEHGLFDSTLPTNTTLERLRTPEGIIERHKDGFRRLFYRNDNGFFLTVFDSRVLIGLMKLWQDKGEGKLFEFQFKELLHAIELELNGGNYVMIAKSLDNLARTQIVMEEYLDPKTKKRTKTKIHNPIQNAVIDERNCTAKIQFNDLLHESLKQGNYVNISITLFNDLANDTSKNLYMFIVNYIQTMQHEGEIVLDIDPLIEHIGVNASTRTKKVNLIKDALEELKGYEILQAGEVVKVGRFHKYVRFEESPNLRNRNLLEKSLFI